MESKSLQGFIKIKHVCVAMKAHERQKHQNHTGGRNRRKRVKKREPRSDLISYDDKTFALLEAEAQLLG